MNGWEIVGTKSNVSFETDTSLYTVQTGAWDCIATLPAADGSLFGYFFAKAKQTLPGAHGGGGGIAHSTDGIHWRALSPVAGSASSVFRFGPRIWLTDMTLSGPATSPSGPFKSSVVNDRGHLVNMVRVTFRETPPRVTATYFLQSDIYIRTSLGS